jgi:hypothetical protein
VGKSLLFGPPFERAVTKLNPLVKTGSTADAGFYIEDICGTHVEQGIRRRLVWKS